MLCQYSHLHKKKHCFVYTLGSWITNNRILPYWRPRKTWTVVYCIWNRFFYSQSKLYHIIINFPNCRYEACSQTGWILVSLGQNSAINCHFFEQAGGSAILGEHREGLFVLPCFTSAMSDHEYVQLLFRTE